MSSRRLSTLRRSRTIASDLAPGSKTVELEQRLSRLEVDHKRLQDTVSLLVKRNGALQAQLDHLAAKLVR